jgi:hypothetical protein
LHRVAEEIILNRWTTVCRTSEYGTGGRQNFGQEASRILTEGRQNSRPEERRIWTCYLHGENIGLEERSYSIVKENTKNLISHSFDFA